MASTASAHDMNEVTQDSVQQFIFREARLLDERRFDDWLMLFADECRYWIPASIGQGPTDLTLSIINDDRSHLEDRIFRILNKPPSQDPPSRTCHVVTNVELLDHSLDTVHAATVLVIHELRCGVLTTLPGRLEYTIDVSLAGEWRIVNKTVRLMTCDQPFVNLSFLM